MRTIRLNADAIAYVQRLADQEDRGWSDMLRVLLKEAIDARAKKGGRKT